MSAPRIASSALPAGEISTPGKRGECVATNCSASASVVPATRTLAIGRTSVIPHRCVPACTPVPMIASSDASGLASARVATAEAAGVRTAVR